MKRILLVFALLLIGVPIFAAAEPRQCDPTGTWYDEAWNYLGTITHNADGSYTIEFHASYDLKPFGYGSWTNWSGHMLRRGPRYFEVQQVSMYAMQSDDPATAPKEVDIVHSFMRLKEGCNTIVNTIDGFGAYYPMTADKVPFVTDVDQDYLPGDATIVEIYHRMKELK